METKQLQVRLLTLIFLAGVTAWVWVLPLVSGGLSASVGGWQQVPYLQVHFLSVGQGDAIFIQTPDGVEVLIDGGPDGTVIRELAKLMPFFDKQIDVVIGTHPDKDHIGGLIDVLERFDVSTIIKTENINNTSVAKLYEASVTKEGAEVIFARRGQTVTLGASTTLSILYPETNPADMESNASSIVLKVVYGKNSFMLTGDSPKRIEEYLVLVEGENLKSDVLKVGHHGSRTSTSELFLAEVDPSFAVVSAGANNQYGHPHLEVTDVLFNNGVTTLNTAESGTITFYSDGTKLWLKE